MRGNRRALRALPSAPAGRRADHGPITEALRAAVAGGRLRLDPRPLYFQPRRFQEIRNSSIKLRVVVENDITAAHGVRESLAELLEGPLGGRMTGNVEVQDSAAPMWMTNRQ